MICQRSLAVLFALVLLGSVGSGPGDTLSDRGPDKVMLDALVDYYEPVPFDHKRHADMADMWRGCVTCHHRTPKPKAGSHKPPKGQTRTQAASSVHPACRTCHSPGVSDDFRVPGLKGAYHRQCLNCHKDWMGDESCVICHAVKDKNRKAPSRPSPDDIIGRMCPPIPEPKEVTYRMRYTPADGGRVLFRHKEHVRGFRIGCANCHHQNTCSDCHDGKNRTIRKKPLKPSRTWDQSHGPCLNCHRQDRCRHCHYKAGTSPPRSFTHRSTGQLLDKDHAGLRCDGCHPKWQTHKPPSCGTAKCHPKNPAIAFPEHWPGKRVTTKPTKRTAGPVKGVVR